MELYIHFGIYKAGSSYLQYILANSSDFLEQHKIYFPTSKEDKKMKEGLISKGNADGLEKILIQKNEEGCTKILQIWKEEAMRKNCNKVLISAEALVHQLAINDSIDTLVHSSKKAGYTSIKAMGFFRDLVDHALSTYKHRAKTGKIPDYLNWISHVYETPELLKNLTSSRLKYDQINWTFRKFQKDSNFLKKAFFVDWLQIEVPNFNGKSKVNESLTLSEILVMNEIRKKFPLVTDYFVNDLKAIPKELKGQNRTQEEKTYNEFYNILSNKKLKITHINQFFLKNEELSLGNINPIENLSSKINESHLTEVQLRRILNRITFFYSFQGRIIYFKRRLSFILNHLKISKLK